VQSRFGKCTGLTSGSVVTAEIVSKGLKDLDWWDLCRDEHYASICTLDRLPVAESALPSELEMWYKGPQEIRRLFRHSLKGGTYARW